MLRIKHLIILSCVLTISCALFQKPGKKLGVDTQSASEIKKQITADVEIKKIEKRDVPVKLIYLVEKKDSLWMISGKIYGDNFLWPKLMVENGIENPDCIYIGQRIYYLNDLNSTHEMFIDQAKKRRPYTSKLCK